MTSSNSQKRPEESLLDNQLDRLATRATRVGERACLVVSTGEAAGAVFPLMHPAILIGRSKEAKVRIDEHAISSEHALLELDESNFTLRDLGSTNGTFVNGVRIARKVVLAGGDTVQMGSTTFLFLTRESQYPEGTVKLHSGSELVFEPRRSRPPLGRASVPAPSHEHTGSMSLTDMVKHVRKVWGFSRRYGWILALLAILGAGAGAGHALLRPPPGSAWFEMQLGGGARNEHGDTDWLTGAENTFRSLPLIRKTLSDLGAQAVSEGKLAYTQNMLAFRRTAYNSNVYRGEFEDTTAERAAAFLSRHIDNYIDSELDKVLQVLRMDAEFDSKQEEAGKARVVAARESLVAFSEKHPEVIPKDGALPRSVPAASAPRRESADRAEQAIAQNERALRTAYLRIQTQKAAPYREQLAAVEARIADARLHGLKDQHPDLQKQLQLQASLREKVDTLLAAEPTAAEQALDPELVRLQEEQAEQRRRSSGASIKPRASSAASQSFAQLRIEYGELAGDYERTKAEHQKLLDKRDTAERQLERERTSARSRYNLITPPTPANKPPAVVMAKRAGMGAAAGVLLALALAAYLELRRLLISRGHIAS